MGSGAGLRGSVQGNRGAQTHGWMRGGGKTVSNPG